MIPHTTALCAVFLMSLQCYDVRMRVIISLCVAVAYFVPISVAAHMPVLVGSGTPSVITDPERSYAFYDTLTGASRTYHVSADHSWSLYLNLLVPSVANPNGRFDAMVINRQTQAIVAALEGRGVKWKPYYEEFGADNYLRGPELSKTMEPGEYDIVVTGEGNTGPYTLALGTRESFSLSEVIETLALIPRLKREFFKVSPASFVASPLGGTYALLMVGAGFLLAMFIRRFLRRRLSDITEFSMYAKNIGTRDRMVRVVLGLTFLLLAILTSWHPVLFIAAGFSIYQALNTWCLVYSLMGKNTCAISE